MPNHNVPVEVVLSGDDVLLSFGKLGPDQAVLCCPACGFEYTHVISAGTLMGSDPKESIPAYPGTEKVGDTHERRSGISLRIECEGCDVISQFVIQQYKGNNLLYWIVEKVRKQGIAIVPTS